MFGVNHIVFDSHLNMRVCNSTCMPAMDMFIAHTAGLLHTAGLRVSTHLKTENVLLGSFSQTWLK